MGLPGRLGSGWRAGVAWNLAVAALYAGLGQVVGSAFAVRNQPILVWPSSGVALAAVLLDPRLWPGVLLGTFLDARMGQISPALALYEAVGKTLAALLGAWVLRRVARFDPDLTHPRDLALLGLAGALSASASALAGSTTLVLDRAQGGRSFLPLLLEWWQGDMLGILLVAPILLVWRRPPRGWLGPDRLVETLSCFGLAVVFGHFLFLRLHDDTSIFMACSPLMFILVAWSAWRYGRHGALLTIQIAGVEAMVGAVTHVGYFGLQFQATNLVGFWFYMLALTVVGMALALIMHDLDVAARALGDAKQAAEAASQMKSEFLANMSHEIRTPMNAILGLSHLALQSELSARQEDYLQKIQGASRALLRLVDDILDVSKIEAGRLEIESVPFHLPAVVEKVAGVARVRADEKGLELLVRVSPSVPPRLVGDPLRLEQVLLNLASNAVKFTERGQVRIAVDTLDRPGPQAWLRFSVLDTGIGVTPEQQARLFLPFSQADGSTTRKYGGTGLGLVICRQLVHLMGGEIEMRSTAGVGSEFSFQVPFGLHAEEAAPAGPDLESRHLRVLLADDDEVALEVLGAELARLRFDVTPARSGREALDELARAVQAGERPYDLVLLDWKMPELDGLETARLIQGDPRLPRLPILFMVTAHSGGEVRSQAESLGFNAFLTKPVSPSLLFDHLVSAFGPAVARPWKALGELSRRPLGLAGARVLVVDDLPLNQQVAREILRTQGIEAQVASGGREALERLASETFDAVLMDVQMPEMDGYEATRRIREDLGLVDLPILATTAHAMKSERDRCLAAGMSDHLPKPLEPEQLFTVLVRWLAPGLPAARNPAEPAAGPSLLPATLPGVDLVAARRRLAGNETLLLRLLREFRTTWNDVVPRMEAALAEGRGEEVARLAHALRGTASNLALPEVSKAAEEVERAPGRSTLSVLGRALQPVLEALETLPEPERPSGGEDANLAGSLRELAALLRDQDFEATKRFEPLRPLLPESELARRLEEQVEVLDFAGALESVEALARNLARTLPGGEGERRG